MTAELRQENADLKARLARLEYILSDLLVKNQLLRMNLCNKQAKQAGKIGDYDECEQLNTRSHP